MTANASYVLYYAYWDGFRLIGPTSAANMLVVAAT